MTAPRFLNGCIWNAASAGTGAFVVSSAQAGYYAPASCSNPSVVDGGTYRYFARQGTDHEEGYGVWTTSSSTLTRATILSSSNAGAAVNFASAPVVCMGGPLAMDMVGTTTNDDANAGGIGEYIFSEVLSGSAVSLANATAKTVTSISLTAGDWEVWGTVLFNIAGTTNITSAYAMPHTVSDTLATAPNAGAYNGWVGNSTGVPPALATGKRRYSLGSTTTVYLIVWSQFSVSTLQAFGFLGARRIR